MAKLELDFVRPLNLSFYDRYVDDCFFKKKKVKLDDLPERLNNSNPNMFSSSKKIPTISLTLPSLMTTNSIPKSTRNLVKLPTHWKSEILTKLHQNPFSSLDHIQFEKKQQIFKIFVLRRILG